MRRGWMDWVPSEVPEALLRERVGQVATACQEHGLDALVLYASFVRPAQISALAHFVPFWSQALLVITATGGTLLTMATTGRTVLWIRKTSCVDEVIVGPDIGATAARWLAGRATRIGVAAMSDVPQAALDALCRDLPGARLEDAQSWYAALEAGFHPPPLLARRALAIAQDGLRQVDMLATTDAHAIVAAVEGHCRQAGAEDVLVWMAPDLDRSAALQRLEGEVTLGERFAVQASLAYKGCWLRLATSYLRTANGCVEDPTCGRARAALRDQPIAADAAAAAARAAGATLEDWRVEARRAGLPLADIAGPQHGGGLALPRCATLSLQLRAASGSVRLATPLNLA